LENFGCPGIYNIEVLKVIDRRAYKELKDGQLKRRKK
jgi:hypothetical protein